MADETPPIDPQEAEDFFVEAAHSLTKRTILGARLSAGIAGQIREKLAALQEEISAQIAAADINGVTRLAAKRARLAKLVQEVAADVKETYAEIEELSSGQITDVVAAELKAVKKALSSVGDSLGLDLSVEAPSAAETADVLAEPVAGGLEIADLWAQQEQQLVAIFTKEMRLGQIAGETINQLVERINGKGEAAGLIDRFVTAAETTVDTAIHGGQQNAILALANANKNTFPILTHASVLDSKTSYICLARAGLSWDAETKEPLGHDFPFSAPPLHPNCLPADSFVSPGGRVAAVSKRWFDGDLIIIRTASGRELSATPNHPILTDRGWVGAALIDEGDRVVCIGVADRALRSIGYDENVKAEIHKFAEPGFISSDVATVPVPMSTPDFHGDGTDGEVAIITIDCSLLRKLDATISEPLSEPKLGDGHHGFDLLAGFGRSNDDFVGLGRSANYIVSGLDHVGTLNLGGALPSVEHLPTDSVPLAQVLPSDLAGVLDGANFVSVSQNFENGRFADLKGGGYGFHGRSGAISGDDLLGADLRQSSDTQDASGFNDPSNPAWIDAELFRDLLSAQSGEVEFDDVVVTRRERFSGHVYNLQTATGWFAAEGIVTHNCRSILIPGFSTQAAKQRLNPKRFLDSLSDEEQNDVLGPGRAKLFRAGKITVRELVDQSDRPLTLAELEP